MPDLPRSRLAVKFYEDDWLQVWQGHSLDVLRELPTESVHMAVTSPPYYGLRDYGLQPIIWGGDADCPHEWDTEVRSFGAPQGATGERADRTYTSNGKTDIATCLLCGAWLGQLGLEPSPRLYVTHLVEIFRELRRVLRHDGTFWLNIGDSYAQSGKGGNPDGSLWSNYVGSDDREAAAMPRPMRATDIGLKPKDLIGIPWMLAFALRDDGWYLRSDVIWAKPNVMPESVDDRPTKAHEYLFLLSKSTRYFYDNKAIEEPLVSTNEEYLRAGKSVRENHAFGSVGGAPLGEKSFATVPTGRNKRTVWSVASQPYAGAHYAPFPPKLIEPTILAGTSEHGVCAECGAPWHRIIDRERSYDHVTTAAGKQIGGPYESQIGGGEDGHDVRHGVYSTRTTVGWEASCDHTADVVPALVLDPFAGSGTTGLVAQRLSRRALLVDLNGEYVRQQLIRNANLPLGL